MTHTATKFRAGRYAYRGYSIFHSETGMWIAKNEFDSIFKFFTLKEAKDFINEVKDTK